MPELPEVETVRRGLEARVVGRKIMETAARTNLKRISLELCGKSPTLIFDDADLEQAIKWAIGGIL